MGREIGGSMKRLSKFFKLIWQDIQAPLDDMLHVIGVVIIASSAFIAVTYAIAKLLTLALGKTNDAAYAAFWIWFLILVGCIKIKYLRRKWNKAGREIERR